MGALKNILKVSLATVGSRILGLVRDSATLAYMGMGAVSSAYTFAFTMPNLFRRLLGEGALTAALVPIFSQSLKRDGEEAAFDFLNKVISRTALATAAICLLACALSAAFAAFAPEETPLRYLLGAKLLVVLMPYMALICLAAVFTAALNVLGSFGVPSITPALLNLAIIGALFAGVWTFGKGNAETLACCLCCGWLLGGFLQLALPAYKLRKMGWRFCWNFEGGRELGELAALFVPAVLGAAVIQLNIFSSKMLALFLSNEALPALYVTGRILEFPLGVFTIAIATVYFPKLASLTATSNTEEHRRTFSDGLVMTMCISIPATVGIIALAREILSMLFEWGMFSASDVDLCINVLYASVAGLPFFSLATFATRGFHSAKDTKTPVKISIAAFATNIIASLALMFKFGATGLAAANTVAAVVQAILLSALLRKKLGSFNCARDFAKIAVSAAVMLFAVLAVRMCAAQVFSGKTLAVATCAIAVPAGGVVYFACLKILKFGLIKQLQNTVFKRR